MAVTSAVLKIGLLVAVGIKLELKKMLDGPKRKCLSALAMDICLPCLLFSDVLPEANGELIKEGGLLLLWPFLYAIVGCLLGVVCCLLVGTPMQHLGAAAACVAFPNVNGFPVSIIAALGSAIPKSSHGFSPMVFLALIQLTDGLVKYTVGPAIFKRDLAAIRAAREKRGEAGPDDHGDLPLGASLRTISVGSFRKNSGDIVDLDAATPNAAAEAPALTAANLAKATGPAVDLSVDLTASMKEKLSFSGKTAFGLTEGQYRTVEPDWSRFDAGHLLWSPSGRLTANNPPLKEPLLPKSAGQSASQKKKNSPTVETSWGEFLRQLAPPQVTAVLLALLLGMGPSWLKSLLYDPEIVRKGGVPVLGFIMGTAKALGGGFVPLQMISLGGRLVNVVGDQGPLAATGEAGPRGRRRLLKICGAVGIARMLLTPFVVYGIALTIDQVFDVQKPFAFWAPALIVPAMPTANNMSTMADLVGSGRSITAAGVAMQLVTSPVVLAITLSILLAGAQNNLAADMA
eukprot:CAMPEP_0206481836 /NCGR_PEP_ID=MMETSP0324_2-20121206/38425_1 /ASSEMBLY_ACC=CAM_ASM_000836 /TAXON_ID=2866 /ORGANISM="Crypthecodinium cohnii, Strain Seligo" /LENGTH=515 /DNA_ID=CAMNT_0053959487 /DNA_START=107 /DNA_END=1654 /DNA_ORIENTATION=-